MKARNKLKARAFFIRLAAIALCALFICPQTLYAQEANIEYGAVKLRFLDKVTARTVTFDSKVEEVMKFGSIYIKVRACRKTPEMEKPEAASFLQIWEVPPGSETQDSQWVFSGWMFSSSPGLSSMDHPIYDVWVLDCVDDSNKIEEMDNAERLEGEGVVKDQAVPMQPTSGQ